MIAWKLQSWVTALALLIGATPAAAALNGTAASVTYAFPDSATPYGSASYAPAAFTIGAGVESVVNIESVTDFNVDFTDTGLNIVFDTVLDTPTFNTTSFNGLVFSGSGFAGIKGVTVLTSTLAGFNLGRVTVVGDQLRLNWSGLGYVDGTTLNLAFTFVPEPATWLLLIAGFGATGAVMRHRRLAQV